MYNSFKSVDQRIDGVSGDLQYQCSMLYERIDAQARTLGRIMNDTRKHKACLEELYAAFDLSVLDACGIITNGFGHGSCVAIGEDLILTAGHCLGYEGSWIEINGRRYEIVEEWKSEKYDVGFVRVRGKVPFVKLGLTPELLDVVYLVGSPYDQALRNSITKGIVSALGRDIHIWDCLIQVDAEGAPGSSGCMLSNIEGDVLGICVAGPNPGGGVTLCVPVWQIRSTLRTYLSR